MVATWCMVRGCIRWGREERKAATISATSTIQRTRHWSQLPHWATPRHDDERQWRHSWLHRGEGQRAYRWAWVVVVAWFYISYLLHADDCAVSRLGSSHHSNNMYDLVVVGGLYLSTIACSGLLIRLTSSSSSVIIIPKQQTSILISPLDIRTSSMRCRPAIHLR